ncbi:MAG: hypothetical protein HYY06_02645 [Deltaproteobacteria bacterium]|nr:hypothetical protein [Deltaproteobacteria bacterium]
MTESVAAARLAFVSLGLVGSACTASGRGAMEPCVARTAFLGGRVVDRTIFDVDSATFRFDGVERRASRGGWVAMRPAWPGAHAVEVEITLRGRETDLFPYLGRYTTQIRGATAVTATPGCAVDVVATAADARNPHDRPFVRLEARRACDVPAEDIPEPEPEPEPAGPGAEATAAFGRECVIRAAVARAHLERALETARIRRDVVAVFCLTDQLRRIEAVRTEIEQALASLAAVAPDELPTLAARLETTCGRLADLQREARGCG